MSKIVLIHPNFIPPFKYNKNKPYTTILSQPPMSLLCLAAVLEREGHQIKIIDCLVEDNVMNLIKRETKDAFLVGITAMTVQVKNAVKISEMIKKENDVPIVWGGCHATLFPEQTCRDKSVDFVVIGEGESTLLELVRALESGKSYKNIKGLVYEENGVVRINPLRDHLDIEKLPIPAYHLVDMLPYLKNISLIGKRERLAIIESSRGCPHRCAFCINVVANNQEYRMKSPKKVLNEIEVMINKYNIDSIAFRDDNFFVNRNRVKAICEGMIKRKFNITWDASCRADYFRDGFLDDQLVSLMRKSGCVSLRIGAESGSQRMLDLMKKDLTPKQILHSAKMCDKYDIIPTYSFMVGLPHDKKEDMLITIKFIKKIKKICPTSNFGVGPFRPYPGGELYEVCVKSGAFKEPKTLRDWANDKYIKLYTSDIEELPWTENPEFAVNISHYANLADKRIKTLAKKMSVIRSIHLFFVLLAKLRWRLEFFNLPYDKYIFQKLKNIYLS
jgi:radical SAM superfamily enzyme YgiQ (UPF0313 family)